MVVVLFLLWLLLLLLVLLMVLWIWSYCLCGLSLLVFSLFSPLCDGGRGVVIVVVFAALTTVDAIAMN